MAYWVYENWRDRPKKAKVHFARCSHCNHGKGKAGGTSPENGRWVGSFDNFEDAMAHAMQTSFPDTDPCKICDPS